jgi:hypothetical protein
MSEVSSVDGIVADDSCLKESESTTLRTTSHFGPLQFASDLCSVDTLASCELCSQASINRKRSVITSGRSVGGCGRWPEVDTYGSVHLGNNIPHELQRENNSLPSAQTSARFLVEANHISSGRVVEFLRCNESK